MKPPRIFINSLGPTDWRAKLADPVMHWRREKSAWELAVSWESRRNTETGMPDEIQNALNSNQVFQNARLLFAAPEHRVFLDDDRRPSQNDLWAVLLLANGYASVAIEAKAGEEFDKPIAEWLREDSNGKIARLLFLCKTLGLPKQPPGEIRYQLLHRTASAILEARRWRMATALMLVQSFNESPTSWEDYCAFARLLGLEPHRGGVSGVRNLGDCNLFLGWVDSPMASDLQAAIAL